MAASDDLTALAERAKAAEDHVAKAKSQARAEVERQVTKRGEAARQKADRLAAETKKAKAGVPQWWNDVQRTWSGHVARLREDMKGTKAQMDADMAQVHADATEDEAVVAVAFAEAALEEAEYAVLNAALARMDAEAATR